MIWFSPAVPLARKVINTFIYSKHDEIGVHTVLADHKRNVKFIIKMRLFTMFATADCVLFLIKLCYYQAILKHINHKKFGRARVHSCRYSACWV